MYRRNGRDATQGATLRIFIDGKHRGYTVRLSGRGPGCQYPAAMVHNGALYVIYSIGKEDVAVSWVQLSRLRAGG